MTGNRPRAAVQTVVAAVVSALMMVGLGFAAVPSQAKAAADGIHWLLHPGAVTFDGHGVSYRLRTWVSDGSWHDDEGGYEREQLVRFVISSHTRTSSTMHATQTHYFDFTIHRLNQPGFSHPTTMNTAALHAWDQYGHMRINLKFAASAAPSASCDGHTLTRRGRLSGTILFRPPHSQVGTIDKIATWAILTHGDGTCAIGTGPQPQLTSAEPCATGTYVAMGRATPSWLPLSFFARHDPDSDTATINVLSTSAAANPGISRTIVATVPADHVDIASDLSSITIRGGGGSYLSGTAHAVATGPPTPWTQPAGCPSHTAVEGSLVSDEGTYTGNFTARFLLGGTKSIADLTVNATAVEDIQQAQD